jgi:O-antigen ligase
MTSIRTNLANGLALFGIAGASIGVILFGNALTNTFMALCLLGCLLHPNIWNITSWKMVPIGLWLGLALFLWAVVASVWSTGTSDDIGETLRKYREFFLLPLMWLVVHQLKFLGNVQTLLICALIFSVVLTFVFWLDWYDFSLYRQVELSVKDDIFFSLSSSFLIYILLPNRSSSRKFVAARIFLICFTLFAVLWIEDGRTGYVISASLVCWYIWNLTDRFSLRLSGLSLLVIFGWVTYLQSSVVQNNVHRTVNKLTFYFTEGRVLDSTGLRIGWIMTGLEGWTHKPMLGHGTGSYPSEMMNYVPEGQEKLKSANPHQQYVLFLFEQGLIGVLLFVAFLLALFWQTILQKDYVSQGIVLMMILGSGINSSFLDGTESQFYWILLLLFLKPREWRPTDAQDKPV